MRAVAAVVIAVGLIACGPRESAGGASAGAGVQGTPAGPAFGMTVRITVRDGATSRPLSTDRWTARLRPVEEAKETTQPVEGVPEGTVPGGTVPEGTVPGAGVSSAEIMARASGPEEAIAGPVRAGADYSLRIEAPGYAPLIRRVRFRTGVENRLNASLDPLPAK